MIRSVSLFIPDLSVGGAERVVVNLSKGLANQGCDVEIVLLRQEGALLSDIPETVTVTTLRTERLRWSVWPLIHYLRGRKPDSLISFMTGPNVIALLSNVLAGRPSQVIVTEHNTQTVRDSASIKRDMVLGSILYRFSDFVVGVSSGVAEDVAEWANVPEEKQRLIYNPVIEADFVTKTWPQPPHRWFESEEISVIMSAGRHIKQKDFETLIKAFEKIQSEREAGLILLGEGERTDAYEQLAIRLGIRDRLYMPGFVDNPYPYMQHSDAFALSSVWEGLSLVLIESMGCGTPVVSTNCPHGPAEVLADGKYGSLVPVRNPKRLKDAILDVLENPPPKDMLKQRAQDFSIETATEQYLELINS